MELIVKNYQEEIKRDVSKLSEMEKFFKSAGFDYEEYKQALIETYTLKAFHVAREAGAENNVLYGILGLPFQERANAITM